MCVPDLQLIVSCTCLAIEHDIFANGHGDPDPSEPAASICGWQILDPDSDFAGIHRRIQQAEGGFEGGNVDSDISQDED